MEGGRGAMGSSGLENLREGCKEFASSLAVTQTTPPAELMLDPGDVGSWSDTELTQTTPPLEMLDPASCEETTAQEVQPPVSETEVMPNQTQDDEEEDHGLKTLRTIDQVRADDICKSSLATLNAEDAAGRYEDLKTRSLATWMILMVRRVELDDPDITRLNFTNLSMPTAEQEPRIVPKLLNALCTNTHLTKLSLSCSNLQSTDQLANVLSVNQTLEVVEVQCNFLTVSNLEGIFNAISHHSKLKEIRCSDQLCSEQADNNVLLAAIDQALKRNRNLQKVGMDLPATTLAEQNFRDQIIKSLIKNTEAARKKKQRKQEEIRRREEDTPKLCGGKVQEQLENRPTPEHIGGA